MKERRYNGIVLHCKPIFEKDKRIDLFTKKNGRKSFILKRGQIKPYPFSGTLESLNSVSIESFQGKSMAYIKQCSLEKSFSSIRTNFNTLSCAGYILDILKKATHQDQQNTALFELATESFNQLNIIAKNDKNPPLIKFQNAFETQFLICEGLIDSHKAIPHHQFREYFYQYTGQLITAPTLLSGIMTT